jgi:hypothetical protein
MEEEVPGSTSSNVREADRWMFVCLFVCLTGGSNKAMGTKDSRRKSLAGRMAIFGSTGG